MFHIYDKKYFFSECEGFKSFLSSKGLKLSRRLQKIYNKIISLKPKRVLDFGCGRGELALNLALTDIETYGIDISDDAINISEEIKNYWIKTNPEMKLNFLKLKNNKLNFNDSFFDIIILSDVIEHLTENEIKQYFKEFHRILNKNGIIIIHTSPNKIFLNYGLKIYWLLGKINGLNLPFNIKSLLPEGLKDKFHINLQTSYSIKKQLKRSGFTNIEIEIWKNPHYIYYLLKEDKYIKIINQIYKFFPFKQLFFADILAIAKKGTL